MAASGQSPLVVQLRDADYPAAWRVGEDAVLPEGAGSTVGVDHFEWGTLAYRIPGFAQSEARASGAARVACVNRALREQGAA